MDRAAMIASFLLMRSRRCSSYGEMQLKEPAPSSFFSSSSPRLRFPSVRPVASSVLGRLEILVAFLGLGTPIVSGVAPRAGFVSTVSRRWGTSPSRGGTLL